MKILEQRKSFIQSAIMTKDNFNFNFNFKSQFQNFILKTLSQTSLYQLKPFIRQGKQKTFNCTPWIKEIIQKSWHTTKHTHLNLHRDTLVPATLRLLGQTRKETQCKNFNFNFNFNFKFISNSHFNFKLNFNFNINSNFNFNFNFNFIFKTLSQRRGRTKTQYKMP